MRLKSSAVLVFCGPNTCFVTPHLLQNVDPLVKSRWKVIYRKVKRGLSLSSIGAILLVEGRELVYDIAKSQVKKQGYKMLLAVSAYPMLQAISIPVYLISNHKKIRCVARSIATVGSFAIQTQMEFTNLSTIGLDLLLFGEHIPVADNSNFSIWRNETGATFDEIISTFNE